MIKWCIATVDGAKQPPLKPRLIWSRADWDGLKTTLGEIDWDERFSKLKSVDECYNDFVDCYHKACEQHIPKTTAPIRLFEAPWLDDYTRACLNEKSAAYGRLRAAGKKHKDQLTKDYKVARKAAAVALKAARRDFEIALAKTTRDNGKDLHAYINRQLVDPNHVHALKDANRNLCTDDDGKCRILNECFHAVFTMEPPDDPPPFADRTRNVLDLEADSLYDTMDVFERLEKLDPKKSVGPDGVHPRVLKSCAHELSYPLATIFRRSHVEGRAPKLFKQANITPIFKKGCRATASNYRPISITSEPCKVQESIIHAAILGHLSREKLIKKEQHGFLPNKSCTTNLLESYEIMCDAMAKSSFIDVIYMDFSKAFDTVAHRRLLHKLRAYGIRGRLLAWITDWLTTREQRVVLNTHSAEWKDVLSGVPQGSVLGPLLFVVFINDLVDVVQNAIRMYADDTKILGKADTPEDRARLQEDIDNCVTWANTWLMKYNIAKCKVMHVGGRKRKQTSPHTYTMRDDQGTAHPLEMTRDDSS